MYIIFLKIVGNNIFLKLQVIKIKNFLHFNLQEKIFIVT